MTETTTVRIEPKKPIVMESENEPTMGKLLAPMFTPEALKAERATSHAELMDVIALDARNEDEETSLVALSEFKLMPDNPTKADALAFVESAMKLIGIGFHPDTDFTEYIQGGTNNPLFNRTDSIALNWQIMRAGELLEGEEEDVYGVCVKHAQSWYAETKDDVDSFIEIDER